MELPSWCRPTADGIVLDVLVQPRCSREGVGPVLDGRLKVRVHAAPVGGEANGAVVRLLARALSVSRSSVQILVGQSGRRKSVAVRGITGEHAASAIDAR